MLTWSYVTWMADKHERQNSSQFDLDLQKDSICNPYTIVSFYFWDSVNNYYFSGPIQY